MKRLVPLSRLSAIAVVLWILAGSAAAESPEVSRLAALLTDDSAVVRKRAAIALGELGAEAKSAVPALNKALTDPDPAVRAAVAEALEKVEGGGGTKITPPPPPVPLKDLVLKGHTNDVFGVAFTPDGKHVAACGRDGTVLLWDSYTGKQFKKFTSGDELYALAVSPDGKRLAAAGTKAGYVWDLKGGAEPILKAPDVGDYGIAYSPDGRRLVSGGRNRTLTVWDAITGKTVATPKGHTDIIYDAAFSPDGKHVADASQDGTARVYDAATGNVVYTSEGHQQLLYGAAFSPDGKRLATAGVVARTVRLRDALTGQGVVTLTDAPEDQRGLAFSPDGQLLAVAGDEVVKVWDLRTGKQVAVFKGHTATVVRVAWSPDGRRLASSSWDHDVRVWVMPK